MSQTETLALRRAVVVLLVVSAARWIHAAPRASQDPLAEVGVEHALATRAAVEEEERRTRPLADGERIDLNRADAEELDRLPGVGAAKARAIVAAREAGLVFRTAGDLTRVAGFGPASVERLTPFLELGGGGPAGGVSRAPAPVDVNRADEAELTTLPGIGPVTAARIVAARRERPFASTDDLRRVQGIGPATLARLEGLVTVRRTRR